MKKLLLVALLLGSYNSFANEILADNYTVSYDCGFISGFGLMGAEPEYEGVDKVFAPKTTVTIGKEVLANPSYIIQMSHKNEHSQTCTVAGAGEYDEFHWYISKNKCSKIVKYSLDKKQITECGVTVELSK
jgi:hypothetical protein